MDVDGLEGCPSVGGMTGYVGKAASTAGGAGNIFNGIAAVARVAGTVATVANFAVNVINTSSQQSLVKQQLATNSINNSFISDPVGANPSYSIYQRCFAPWEKFGNYFKWVYHGDDRGFSLSDDVTARVASKITVTLEGKLTYKDAYCDETIEYNSRGEITGRDRATPSFLVTGPRKSGTDVRVRTHLWGSNPLITGAPPIEWMGDFTISNHIDKGYIDLSYQINGKGFPAFETFIEDPKGTRAFIAAYQSPEKGEAAIRLLGSPFQEQVSGTIRFFTDSQGNFTGTVQQYGVKMQIKFRNNNITNTKAAKDL